MQWTFVRDAISEIGPKFVESLRTVTDPHARAVGEWDVADTAAHVLLVTRLNTHFAAGTEPDDDLRPVLDKAATVTMHTVEELNQVGGAVVKVDDVAAQAERIERQLESLLHDTAELRGADRVGWLGGLPLPRRAVLAHTLSELLVHGHDIAGAEGREFAVPASAARLYFELFLVEVIQWAYEVGFISVGRVDDPRSDVTWELRLRGSKPIVFTYEHGRLSVGDCASRVDVRIAADPAAMLLVLYNRLDPLTPVLRGKIKVWGRRPWRLQRVTHALQTP